LTQDQRFENVALATKLGRIFPVFGIVEGPDGKLRCECGKPACGKHAGKHPRHRDWKQQATTNLSQIAAWFELYPNGNFGVVMGERSIAVDADLRPDEGKYGIAELEYLEVDHGRRLPYSVAVLSGRMNGSKHIFFQLPPAVRLDSLSSPFHAVDLIKNGYCVAPGSRHLSGNYYRFDADCGPHEQDIAEMPDFLLEALGVEITAKEPVRATVTTDTLDEKLDPAKAVTPGRMRPNWVVERQIRRDPIAGPLFAGFRQSKTKAGRVDRSRDDFSLCKYLAFYTSHHWHQYCRFFEKSGLYRGKPDPGYIQRTLREAFVADRENWIEKPRKRKSRATGAKRGRRLAADTTAVIALREENPSLPTAWIALQLGCTPGKVRNILSRHRNGLYPAQPSHNSVTLTHMLIIGGYVSVPDESTDEVVFSHQRN
jgi:hypothetical protein